MRSAGQVTLAGSRTPCSTRKLQRSTRSPCSPLAAQVSRQRARACTMHLPDLLCGVRCAWHRRSMACVAMSLAGSMTSKCMSASVYAPHHVCEGIRLHRASETLHAHCAGWIGLAEKSFPEILPHVSTCKSPQGMMGALIKTFFARQLGRSHEDIVVVSFMPCVRKQGEADRDVEEAHSCDVLGAHAVFKKHLISSHVAGKLAVITKVLALSTALRTQMVPAGAAARGRSGGSDCAWGGQSRAHVCRRHPGCRPRRHGRRGGGGDQAAWHRPVCTRAVPTRRPPRHQRRQRPALWHNWCACLALQLVWAGEGVQPIACGAAICKRRSGKCTFTCGHAARRWRDGGGRAHGVQARHGREHGPS